MDYVRRIWFHEVIVLIANCLANKLVTIVSKFSTDEHSHTHTHTTAILLHIDLIINLNSHENSVNMFANFATLHM